MRAYKIHSGGRFAVVPSLTTSYERHDSSVTTTTFSLAAARCDRKPRACAAITAT